MKKCFLGLILLIFACKSVPEEEVKTSAFPNIVVIYTDDQGYGDLGALNPNSKIKTPNLDELAHGGMIFTDGHSSDAVCTPSRYSLLTGRYSWRTSLKEGVLKADGPCLIEEDRTTLATLLKENGYHTGMVGKWHLQMKFPGTVGGYNRDWSQPFTEGPVSRGFEYFFGIPASMNYGVLSYLENDKVLVPPTLWTYRNFDITPRTYRITPPYDSVPGPKGTWLEVAPNFNDELVLKTFTDKAVSYINDNAKKENPFFLYLSLTSPHLPHSTHPDFRGRSDAGNYGDFMEETDYRIGQVIQALKDQGVFENTLIIFSSDNGAEVNYKYQRDTYGHYSSFHFKGGKRDIYEGGHRVPFLAHWPSVIKAGSKFDEPVCQTDVFATLAAIVDYNIEDYEGEDSFNLLPILKGKLKGYVHGPVVHHSIDGNFAIREGKWKLNLFRGSGGSLQPKKIIPKNGEAKYELYNLEEDPGETTNLYFEHEDKVIELEQKFIDIIKKGRSTPGEPQDYVKENWPQVSWVD